MPGGGLKKGDYQEVRMDVNDMVAAMAAKTVDAMINIEPYNAIAESDGMATRDGFSTSTNCRCSWRRRRISCRKTPTRLSPISRRGSKLRGTSRPSRRKSPRSSIRFTPQKATPWQTTHSPKLWREVEVDPGLPSDLAPYMQHQADVLLAEKKINAVPDWQKLCVLISWRRRGWAPRRALVCPV